MLPYVNYTLIKRTFLKWTNNYLGQKRGNTIFQITSLPSSYISSLQYMSLLLQWKSIRSHKASAILPLYEKQLVDEFKVLSVPGLTILFWDYWKFLKVTKSQHTQANTLVTLKELLNSIHWNIFILPGKESP